MPLDMLYETRTHSVVGYLSPQHRKPGNVQQGRTIETGTDGPALRRPWRQMACVWTGYQSGRWKWATIVVRNGTAHWPFVAINYCRIITAMKPEASWQFGYRIPRHFRCQIMMVVALSRDGMVRCSVDYYQREIRNTADMTSATGRRSQTRCSSVFNLGRE